jgi:choline dehydrogenase-like flavoprotein
MAKPPRIAVVGAGLAGSLLALALARRGESPLLLDGGGGSGSVTGATAFSYGGVAGWGPAAPLEPAGAPAWGSGLAAQPPGAHGQPWPLGRLPVSALALLSYPLPFGRVDPRALGAALPRRWRRREWSDAPMRWRAWRPMEPAAGD